MKFEDLPRDGDGNVIPDQVEWPLEYALVRPVESGGRKIEEVTLREPDTTDLELSWKAKSEVGRMIVLIATIGSLSPEDVRAFKAIDFTRLAKAVGDFL